MERPSIISPYVDDLKLYAKNDKELEGLLSRVKQFSDDIGMKFGLDKCPKTTFKTPWGLFEYVVMPLGLTNTPAMF